MVEIENYKVNYQENYIQEIEDNQEIENNQETQDNKEEEHTIIEYLLEYRLPNGSFKKCKETIYIIDYDENELENINNFDFNVSVYKYLNSIITTNNLRGKYGEILRKLQIWIGLHYC